MYIKDLLIYNKKTYQLIPLNRKRAPTIMKQKIGELIYTIVYAFFIAIGHRWMKWIIPRIESYFGFRFSFSQFGEDMIIDSLTRDIKHGVYVDIGCNRPVFFNNTYRLYLKGWTGLNIDGNQTLISRYSRVRPLDTSVCEIVSSNTEETTFFISESGLQSSLHKDYIGNEKILKEIIQKPKTLSHILDSNGFQDTQIDVLCIDVEGHDLSVLKSLNFNKYRPGIICIEDFDFEIHNLEKSKIASYLKKEAYIFASYCKPSVIFVDSDKNTRF